MQWLEDSSGKIASLGVFDDKFPNHVLVNEYIPGQGILVGHAYISTYTYSNSVVFCEKAVPIFTEILIPTHSLMRMDHSTIPQLLLSVSDHTLCWTSTNLSQTQ